MPARTRLFLYVRAGGRCQFDGCNRYLLEHHLTGLEGNFAQMAHIWAFSEGGPRGGRHRQRAANTHELRNLILLCPECHKLVDERPTEFTAAVLREHKRAHEERVFMLTDTKPDRHTVALVLKARVGNKAVAISLPEMQQAVAPRYVGQRDVVTIDLTTIADSSAAEYWSIATAAIDAKARTLFDQTFESGPVRHLSVFALGPIPLLVHLGHRLSDKVPVTHHQRHRNPEDWKWKKAGKIASYRFERVREGADSGSVALLLSLSGRIPKVDLPDQIDSGYSVYEIRLSNLLPTPLFLRREESLHAFRDVFIGAMRSIVSEHPGLEVLHLFPAVPAPVAVALGRDLMSKRDPAVLVYDYDNRAGGFVPTLEVNHDGPQ